MDAPKRMFVRCKPNGAMGRWHDATSLPETAAMTSESANPMCEYILATPEALAASPEVAKLVAEAEARGMERALVPVKAIHEKVCASHVSTLLRRQVVTQLIALESDIRAEAAAIRALAPDAGTAELARLRKRAEKADGMVKRLAQRIRNQRIRLRQMEGFKCRCCDLMALRLQRLKRSNTYRAERDRLAASLAAQTALVETLTGALVNRDGGSHDDDCKAKRYAMSSGLCNCGHDEARAALDAAALAAMTPEERALCERSLAVRAVAKGIAEGRGK